MTAQLFLDDRVVLRAGDCLDVLRGFESNSFDAVVTDPPYALVSIVKRFGKPGAKATKDGDVYSRASAGFMGKAWDTGERAFAVEFWAEVFRVLKPGGHVAAFSGTRTYHRLAVAIEDAGFEIRDQLAWVYGSGFPKSHDVAKGIDKKLGAKGGFGDFKSKRHAELSRVGRRNNDNFVAVHSRPWMDDPEAVDRNARGYLPGSAEAEQWQGWGTALKPAWEPICLARKPLAGTVAENVLAHGVGGLNIDGCRVGEEGGTPKPPAGEKCVTDSVGGFLNAISGAPINAGRWPANILHDGSDEVLAGFPHVESGKPGVMRLGKNNGAAFGAESRPPGTQMTGFGDEGSAARFFYSAKADADDRIGSKHPTVKPVDLMRWLVRLITPPGGCVLDPFAGTGTTGEAAFLEGFKAELIEREEEYRADIARRMGLVLSGKATRAAERVKARHGDQPDDHGPLFGGAKMALGGQADLRGICR